jgi:3-deoxy-D-manno-octulosonic-acid transferase
MSRLIYTLLIYVAAPIAFAITVWRSFRDPAYRDRWAERFGFVRARVDEPSLWIHAVSVGEVQAAAVLIRALKQRSPDARIIVTTATPTGAARVQALFGQDVQHVYLPYDLPGSVRRFLTRIRPRIAIVMETEIWPNLYRECARRRIPLVLASARLSEKSVRRMSRFATVFREALQQNVVIAAQSTSDAERFAKIGAPIASTHVTGNIKFDIRISDEIKQQGRALRDAQFADRFVWVAGSTHEDEEDIMLEAHRSLMQHVPGALLVLVPRHPPRFDSVRQWLAAQRVKFVSRSSAESVSNDVDVLLGDTLGELVLFYAAADVAFVGGSFVQIGGHNLLEPAALGVPVLTGPNNFNAPDIAARLFESGAAIQVTSALDLTNALVALASNIEQRTHMGQTAIEVIDRNRGALERVLAIVEQQLTSRQIDTAKSTSH